MALVKVKGVTKRFAETASFLFSSQDFTTALREVGLEIREGEIMGLVGESGCGKSTLARIILHLISPDAGKVEFKGRRTDNLSRRAFRPFRRQIQAVFQDPRESLNPRYKISTTLEENLLYLTDLSPAQRQERIKSMLPLVGLNEKHLTRFPHQLSGGQRQRVCIARALLLKPELVICDEPTSALDVSIQAQIINLLLDLKEEFGLTYLFISHDLNLIEFVSERLAVMAAGQIKESGKTTRICNEPQSKATRKLLNANI